MLIRIYIKDDATGKKTYMKGRCQGGAFEVESIKQMNHLLGNFQKRCRKGQSADWCFAQ